MHCYCSMKSSSQILDKIWLLFLFFSKMAPWKYYVDRQFLIIFTKCLLNEVHQNGNTHFQILSCSDWPHNTTSAGSSIMLSIRMLVVYTKRFNCHDIFDKIFCKIFHETFSGWRDFHATIHLNFSEKSFFNHIRAWNCYPHRHTSATHAALERVISLKFDFHVHVVDESMIKSRANAHRNCPINVTHFWSNSDLLGISSLTPTYT